ncbi:MAG: ABC transporter ATP-binding protein [Methanosarcinaceae archaeon]|nr:ABC transporter ATP-binding protein [Methanosarcinaceae archaeon]
MCMIETSGLSKYYTFGSGGRITALNDVSITISGGEFVSIVGPSGSGKSTLLNIIGCLDQPSTGDIYLDNARLDYGNAASLVQLRRHTIGFVFQAFNLISSMNAMENVAYPMYFNRVPKPQREKRSLELLESMGLGERALHLPSELSGGEQQRVAIARALVNNPRIILADEPTGNIDSKNGKKIIELMKQVNRDQGITFLVVTHDMKMAENASRVIKMVDGEIVD